MRGPDPFLLVKDEVSASLQEARVLFNRMRVEGRSDELANALEAILSDVDFQVHDLSQTIDRVEKDPRRFGWGDAEFAARRLFVKQCLGEIANFRKPHRQNESLQRQRNVLLQDPKPRVEQSKDIQRRNDDFLNDQQVQQQLIIKEQDEGLDQIRHTVVRLGNMGRDINTELKEQDRIIEEFDEELDTTSGRMAYVHNNVKKVLESIDKGQLGLIMYLIVMLIILIILVFFVD